MKATGMVRRVDDFGRIVLPKEMRKKLGFQEGTPVEILESAEGVLLKRYDKNLELADIAQRLQDAVEGACIDLGPEKTGDIRTYIHKIQSLLGQENEGGKENWVRK